MYQSQSLAITESESFATPVVVGLVVCRPTRYYYLSIQACI